MVGAPETQRRNGLVSGAVYRLSPVDSSIMQEIPFETRGLWAICWCVCVRFLRLWRSFPMRYFNSNRNRSPKWGNEIDRRHSASEPRWTMVRCDTCLIRAWWCRCGEFHFYGKHVYECEKLKIHQSIIVIVIMCECVSFTATFMALSASKCVDHTRVLHSRQGVNRAASANQPTAHLQPIREIPVQFTWTREYSIWFWGFCLLSGVSCIQRCLNNPEKIL